MVKVECRQSVKYVTPTGQIVDALVTAAWSFTTINVVYVLEDESRKDSYGRQIERATSVTHASTPGRAHGNYWFLGSPDEIVDKTHQPKPY